MIDPEVACTQDNFNMDKLIACNKHIYSPDVQYKFSLIEDYDIPPCPNENWALEVILNEFMYSNISKVGSTSNLIFKPTVSQKDFINMGYMLGMVIGSFVFGLMSDHFGRKKTLIFSAIVSGCVCLGSSFITDYWWYFISRLSLGIFSKGLFVQSFMICVEISGVDFRTYLGILIEVYCCCN